MTPAFKSAAKQNTVSDSPDSLQFRRKEGRVHTKKIQRKLKLQLRHIVLSFMVLVGVFFAIQQICLFALTWEKMDIREITVLCPNPEMKARIEKEVARTQWGNILLFDVESLQEKVASHTQVKSVHIRKVLPPSLIINVEERRPFAVLDAENPLVIDNEGVILYAYTLETFTDKWPLLTDKNDFKQYFREKIDSARECLESLPQENLEQVSTIDLSEYSNVKIRLKDSLTWLILGSNNFAEKFRRYQTSQSGLGKFGHLEYVDLRFDERFFIKPLDINQSRATSQLNKEGD